MRTRSGIAVSRRSLIKEQQRIFKVQRMRIEHLFEEFRGISKLRCELVDDFISNFITAGSDSGPDRGPSGPWDCCELPPHFADTFFDNALHRSAPSGMKSSNCALHGIDDDHRQAIRGFYREQHAGNVRDQSVACRWRIRELSTR